jgi:hypothetical protein
MWELVNESEASDCPSGLAGPRCSGHQRCPSESAAAVALRSFFDIVGSEVKRIDPNHLVESGVIGNGQCGTAGRDYHYVHASPGVDVASYHDYGAPDEAVPGDQWNGLQVRLDQSAAVGKPLVVGEVGIRASDRTSGCPSLARRTRQLHRKLDGQFGAGIKGLLTWNTVTEPYPGCTFDINRDDPAFALIRDYRIP